MSTLLARPTARGLLPERRASWDWKLILTAFLMAVEEEQIIIQDRDSGAMVPLTLTPAQDAIIFRLLDQAKAREPLRLSIPKARKEGVSTELIALGIEACRTTPNFHAKTASHTAEGTDELWQIVETIIDHHPWPGEIDRKWRFVEWPNGSWYKFQTGGGREVGRGGTVHYLHLSELASWLIGEKGKDQANYIALANSVPKHSPLTAILTESTGQGPDGEFYEQCKAADETKSNTILFLPWHLDPRYRLTPPADFRPTRHERQLAQVHDLDPAQTYWRRRTLMDPQEFRGSVTRFKHEFPATLAEAFEAAEGRVYETFSTDVHRRLIDEDLGNPWLRYRAIDWGGVDPFVCLWIAEIPGPPGFTVSPECPNTIRELLAYRRDPKTGKPLHAATHCPDCIRYAVVSAPITRHLHVYQELYAPRHALNGRNLLALTRDVLAMSGMVEGAKETWEPGDEWKPIEATFADRSRVDSIDLFSSWGIECSGQTNIARRDPNNAQDRSMGQEGEVEQGIDRVTELIIASLPAERQIDVRAGDLEAPEPEDPYAKTPAEELASRPFFRKHTRLTLEQKMARDEARVRQGLEPRRKPKRHPRLGRGW